MFLQPGVLGLASGITAEVAQNASADASSRGSVTVVVSVESQRMDAEKPWENGGLMLFNDGLMWFNDGLIF